MRERLTVAFAKDMYSRDIASLMAVTAILSVTFTVIISRLIHRSKDTLTPLLIDELAEPVPKLG